MREQLNSNPLAQVALVGALLLAVGFFVMSSRGGGEEGEEATGTEVTAVSDPAPGAPAESSAPSLEAGAAAVPTAPMVTSPPPAEVTAAYDAGSTVVLLFVHDGGIDDELVRDATTRLAALPGVTTFVEPAERISRYAAITEGVGVERVPALVVLTPKGLDEDVPTASVSYGFQSGASVVQAVIDAGYEGPTVDYHP
jgi:hypothetical protein